MEKYTIDELKNVRKYLMDKENYKYTQTEKIMLANVILRELNEINCYCNGKENCPYSVIQKKEEYPRTEVQILCKYLNWIIFTKEEKKVKYFACPFIGIEKDINEFLDLEAIKEKQKIKS